MHKEKLFLCYRNQEKILGSVLHSSQTWPPCGKAVLDVPPNACQMPLSHAGKGAAATLPAFSAVALSQFK